MTNTMFVKQLSGGPLPLRVCVHGGSGPKRNHGISCESTCMKCTEVCTEVNELVGTWLLHSVYAETCCPTHRLLYIWVWRVCRSQWHWWSKSAKALGASSATGLFKTLHEAVKRCTRTKTRNAFKVSTNTSPHQAYGKNPGDIWRSHSQVFQLWRSSGCSFC